MKLSIKELRYSKSRLGFLYFDPEVTQIEDDEIIIEGIAYSTIGMTVIGRR